MIVAADSAYRGDAEGLSILSERGTLTIQRHPIVKRMCGRFVSSSSPQKIASYFDVDAVDESLSDQSPNFNTAPTTSVMVVYEDGSTRRLAPFRWGLVPSWAKDLSIGNRMINARAEGVVDKPSFRNAFARRRCIVPADGFFEWTHDPNDKKKQPYYIHRADGEPYAFAGLWEVWRPKDAGPEEPPVQTCTIITTIANDKMSELHDRMPVILDRDDWSSWLSPQNKDKDLLGKLLVPASNELITFHPVSKDVNNSRSRGDQLIEPL